MKDRVTFSYSKIGIRYFIFIKCSFSENFIDSNPLFDMDPFRYSLVSVIIFNLSYIFVYTFP